MSPVVYNNLIDQLEPYLTDDLDDFVDSLATMFDQLELYIGLDGEDDWGILFDVDVCPYPGLPYLAMYVGERLPVGIDDAEARQWIKDAPNQQRGTVQSIYQAAKRSLTEPKLVALIERSDGTAGDHPDHLVIITYTDQTPDPAQLARDLNEVVPADIALHRTIQDGQSWQQLKLSVNGTSWNQVKSHYPSWSHVATDRTSGIIG